MLDVIYAALQVGVFGVTLLAVFVVPLAMGTVVLYLLDKYLP